MANKTIHTEKCEGSNIDPEYIYEINAKNLFEQAKKLKIPFHKWYQWLDNTFEEMQE